MEIKIEATAIKDVKIIIPSIFKDDRGFFMETYREDEFKKLKLPSNFVQDNHSRSQKGVIRGLHFQYAPPMEKLMRVSFGKALLVAVDIRIGSPDFGKWIGIESSAENRKQVWAPAGFARGFCVLSEWAEIQYKCTSIYNKNGESGILWNDPQIGIKWPIGDPILSEKDQDAITLEEWLATPKANLFKYQGGEKL